MSKKNFVKIFLLFSMFIIIIFLIFNKLNKKDKNKIVEYSTEEPVYNSNIIKDVEYTTIDKDGNEYFIKAVEGEIDFANSNIIFLTDVYALIKLENSENIVKEPPSLLAGFDENAEVEKILELKIFDRILSEPLPEGEGEMCLICYKEVYKSQIVSIEGQSHDCCKRCFE